MPLVHSPAVQGAAGTPSSNPSSSLTMWLKAQITPVSLPGSVPLQAPSPVTLGQRCTGNQTVFEVPQCMAGLCEPSSVCAFQQADAETCFKKKKKKLWLLQSAALMNPLTGLRKPPGCLCTVPCCTVASHTP